jgi:phosphate-selective porin OprO and OprP
MNKKNVQPLLSIVAAAAFTAATQAQTSDPALNVLVKKGIITEQEAKQAIADLEKEKASKTPAPVPITPESTTRATPSVTEAAERSKLWGPRDVRFFWKDGLNFESGDGKTFKGKLGGRLQYDIAGFGQDKTTRDIVGDADTSTEFRRARLYTSGEINEGVPIYYILQMDFAGGDYKFTDAYLGMRDIPYVGSIQLGQMYEPFSLEQLTSDNYVTLPERAAPIEAFSPARNVGVQIQNALFGERMTYAFGAFADDENDKVDGDAFESNGRVTARVTGLPWYDQESGGRRYFHVGVGGSAIDLKDEMVHYRTRPEAHLAPRYVDTGVIPARMAYLGNLEALFTYESFSLQAEYFQTWLDSSGMTGPCFNGFYVMGSWFLTGEHRPYKKSQGVVDRVKPRKNFSFSGSGLGAWELIGRVSQVDLNDGAVRGGRLTDYTVGLGWYLNPNTRFIFNYIYADLHRAGQRGESHIWQTRFQVDF